MANLLALAQRFVDLKIVGSITPAGVLVAITLLLCIAGPVKDSPLQALLYRFSPHYHPEQRLTRLNDRRQHIEHHLRDAQADVLVNTRSRQSAEAALANATLLRDSFQATYLERWEARHALRHEALSKLQEQRDEITQLTEEAEEAEKDVAQAQANADMYRARLESINNDIDCLRGPLCEEISIPFGGLFQSILFVLLLGWLVGIVLNPVNKRILRSGPRTPRPPDQDPLYLIGKNVITQEDYDSLVRNYHRFAQIAASLVVPVLALGVVLLQWTKYSEWYYASPIVAVIFALALRQLARTRYREFRDRVDKFIHGCLNFIRTQKQEAERKEIKDTLVALAKAITEASKLLKLAHSCGCPKCKCKPDSCKHALIEVINDARTLLETAKSCYPPKCREELESRVRALGAAVVLAERRLREARSTCCSDCRPKLDSCEDALNTVSSEADKLRTLIQTCCLSKSAPQPTPATSVTPAAPKAPATQAADAEGSSDSGASADAEGSSDSGGSADAEGSSDSGPSSRSS